MKEMKRLSMVGAVCLALALFLSPVHAKMPRMIGVATGSVGTAGHSMAVGMAPFMEKFFGTTVRVVPASAALVNLKMLKSGKAHFIGGSRSQAELTAASEGDLDYAAKDVGPQKVGMVWRSYNCPFGFFVRGDNKDIKTVADLKGKRVSIYYGTPAWMVGFKAALAFGGLTLDDVRLVKTGGYSPCGQAVVENRSDAHYMAPISTKTYELEETPRGIRWLPMPLEDKAAWKRYHDIAPAIAHSMCTTGVRSAHNVPMANHIFVTWTHMSVDEELIYQVAKFHHKEFEKYKGVHVRCADYSEKSMRAFLDQNPAMTHPGTIRYLKEIGMWTAQDEANNKEAIAVAARYEEAWKKAKAEALAKKIKIEVKNKEWMDLWRGYTKDIPRFTVR
jgi:TRAP transporter TAXI family solute receptor